MELSMKYDGWTFNCTTPDRTSVINNPKGHRSAFSVKFRLDLKRLKKMIFKNKQLLPNHD